MALLDDLLRVARQILQGRQGSQPDEDALDGKSAEDLWVLENQDVPNIGRVSDASETRADEKRDVATSLSFPLHWTTPRESWDYLFDLSVACELLSPRPDDLVLDFGAGTCWATELLCRLGIRTVSMDLSVEMMRRGRQRLATDSRLVFRNEARFVVARGQALPFAAGTFDGILCLNALHHLPSYSVALREIRRVLKPGGRAVFSEPGTAHAVQPLSRFRMREEGILEKNVSLPLIRCLALDAGFRRMKVVPLRSSGAYVFEYAASSANGALLRQMWDETLRLYPVEHARFVLDNGDDPPSDTFLPAHQLHGRLQARIELEQVSAAVRAGESFTDRLRVINTGTITWKAKGRRFGGQVTCGVKICDVAGEVIREDLGRTPLPCDVSSGEVVRLETTIAGVLPIGRYTLRYDMVVEGVMWFELQGSLPARRDLDVTA